MSSAQAASPARGSASGGDLAEAKAKADADAEAYEEEFDEDEEDEEDEQEDEHEDEQAKAMLAARSDRAKAELEREPFGLRLSLEAVTTILRAHPSYSTSELFNHAIEVRDAAAAAGGGGGGAAAGGRCSLSASSRGWSLFRKFDRREAEPTSSLPLLLPLEMPLLLLLLLGMLVLTLAIA